MKKKKAKSKNKKDSWTVNDFVNSVWKTMEEQSEQFPVLKTVHAKLEPEWNKIIQKVALLLDAKENHETAKHIEEICSYGEKAVRPLIDALLKLKSAVMMNKK